MPGRFPKGSRAAIVVNSGGMKGLFCDHCDELKTNLAQLSEKTKEAVRPLIPRGTGRGKSARMRRRGIRRRSGFHQHRQTSCRRSGRGSARDSWRVAARPERSAASVQERYGGHGKTRARIRVDRLIAARTKAGRFKKKPACRSCRRSSRPCERWQVSAYTGAQRARCAETCCSDRQCGGSRR